MPRFAIRLLVALSATLLSVFLLEVGVRIYAYYTSFALPEDKESDLSEALNRVSTDAAIAPTEAKQNVASLRGLITPSQFKDIVYELKPNLHVEFQNKVVTTNSFGIHDKEYSVAKTPGTKRVVGIGDSVMFGWGVAQDKAYLSLLEEQLSTTQQPVEILNFAVPGYNTAMEVATLEHRALEFSPDLIVLHVVNNDWDVPAFMLKRPNPWALDHLFLKEFIETRVSQFKSKVSEAPESGFISSSGDEASRAQVREEFQYMAGASGFKNALDTLATLTVKKGIPVLVLHGALEKKMRQIIKQSAKRYGFKDVSVKRAVDDYMSKNYPYASKERRRELLTVSPFDPHPNALGHELYAEALGPELRAKLDLKTQ